MKGATQSWIAAGLAVLACLGVAGRAAATDTTEADRMYRNFTRETATLSDGQARVEVRGLELQDEENTRLNLYGNLQLPKHSVDKVDGGVVDLLGSYGFAKNAELGIDIPGIIESKRLSSGQRINNSDIADITLYGKFKRSVAEHCWAGGGVELTLPNGPKDKGFSTGELGVNPFISTRYQRGAFAVGTNVGFDFYSGDVSDVFNYGVEAVVRGGESYALRTEIAGRVWNQAGQRFHDATMLPGIDFNVANNLTIRPTGLANLTKTALDWGVGIGLAGTF